MYSLNSAINELLLIFKKALCFFQNVGVLQAYSFSHSEVLYNPGAEKYIHNFILILEEVGIADPDCSKDGIKVQRKDIKVMYYKIKVILKRLYTVQNCQQHDTSLLLTPDLLSTGNHCVTQSNQIVLPSQIITEPNTLIIPQNRIITNSNGYHQVSEQKKVALSCNLIHRDSLLETPASQVLPSNDPVIINSDNNFEEDIPCREPSLPGINNKIIDNDPNVNRLWSEPSDPEKNNSKTASKKTTKCPVCNKELCSKTSLKKHYATHTGDKPFCCEHCGKLFSSTTNLAAHLTRQHNLNTETAHSCPECGKLFVRKSALDTHLAGHRGIKPFSCNVCEKTFTQKVTRDTHVLTHTRDYQYTCMECGKKFPTQSKLNFHMKSHGEPQFSCAICEKKFATRQYLNSHYKTHNLPEAETPHCRLDAVSATTKVAESITKVKCLQCDMCFTSKRSLKRHVECKHNNYTVQQENKTYLSKTQRSGYNVQKRFHICVTCGKSYRQRFSLIHHQRRKHTPGLTPQQQRPHVCHICSKRFTIKAKLTAHIRAHTEEPRHPCSICGRIFNRQDSLKRHMYTHSCEKKFACVTCGNMFHSRSVLNAHAATHTAHFPCIRCGKNLKSKAALSFHMQKHDENYRFACPTCGKQFVRKCHYEGHLRTHSTERPFKCNTCSRTFKDRKHWREHTKRVHGNEINMQTILEDALTSTTHTFHSSLVSTSQFIHDSTFVLGGNQTSFDHVEQFHSSSSMC